LVIEEALHLSEIGSALVRSNGQVFTIAQLYLLLDANKISTFKYLVYSHMVRAGYIVRRPSEAPNICQTDTNYSVSVDAFHFPASLLSQFPSISQNCQSIIIPKIKNMSSDDRLLNDDSELTVDSLNTLTTSWLKNRNSLLFRLRVDREPWIHYRPRNWPNFSSLKSSQNWRIYEMRRLNLLKSHKQRKRNHWKTPSPLLHDYDVLNSPNTTPIYRLLIIDERFPCVGPSVLEISTIAQSSTVPLLVATGNQTCFKISKFEVINDESLKIA